MDGAYGKKYKNILTNKLILVTLILTDSKKENLVASVGKTPCETRNNFNKR